MVAALRNGDVENIGYLFHASHLSLRDDFEVTNDALNQIVECADNQPGCYGARMTGAGFGGCAVAIVAKDAMKEFSLSVIESYKRLSGLNATAYFCGSAELD